MKNINTIDQQELNYWYDELEQIRDSGVCNMWGADQVLIREHGLEKDFAKDLLLSWIKSFNKTEEK